jgi:hypothetical protein
VVIKKEDIDKIMALAHTFEGTFDVVQVLEHMISNIDY